MTNVIPFPKAAVAGAPLNVDTLNAAVERALADDENIDEWASDNRNRLMFKVLVNMYLPARPSAADWELFEWHLQHNIMDPWRKKRARAARPARPLSRKHRASMARRNRDFIHRTVQRHPLSLAAPARWRSASGPAATPAQTQQVVRADSDSASGPDSGASGPRNPATGDIHERLVQTEFLCRIAENQEEFAIIWQRETYVI